MSNTSNMTTLATLFAQADGAIDLHTGGVVPPIQSATTFVRDKDYDPLSPDHIYARDQNDLVRLGERILTQAEHGEDGLLFPSGMAAATAVLRTVPNEGRIVLQSGIYWGVTKWVREFCERRHIELVEVDCSNLDELRMAINHQPTSMIWIETPSNPYLKTVDIAACRELADAVGALLAVDSTAATPIHSQPHDFGAHIVMHSATKAINGHSDVLAGFLSTNDATSAHWLNIKDDRHDAGAVMGSFEAWLLLRGMRTLPLRVERMSASALQIAEFLFDHASVDTVLYPGLPGDPGHELASKQMSGGYGSLLSFLVTGGREDALAIAGRLELFKRATSLGGVESLVEHRHTIEADVPVNLLRISVGIESPYDLISDLEHALS